MIVIEIARASCGTEREIGDDFILTACIIFVVP